MDTNGGYAFPVPNDANNNEDPGMTLRDWFAGQALAGYLADPNVGAPWDNLAHDCYLVADAMLKARKQ